MEELCLKKNLKYGIMSSTAYGCIAVIVHRNLGDHTQIETEDLTHGRIIGGRVSH